MSQETKPQVIAGVFTIVSAPDIQAAAAGMVQTAKDIEAALPDLKKVLDDIPSITGEADKKAVKKVLARLNAHTKEMSESRKGLTRHLDAAKSEIQTLEETEMMPNAELIRRAKTMITEYDAKVEARRQEEVRKAKEAARKAEEEAEALRKKDEAQRAAVATIIDGMITGLKACMEESLQEKSLEKLEACAPVLSEEDRVAVGKYVPELEERFQKLLGSLPEAKEVIRHAIQNPPEITLTLEGEEETSTEELMDQKIDEYVAFVESGSEVVAREDYEDKVADRARREAERAAEIKAKIADDQRKEEALKANSRDAFASYEITDFEALPKDLIDISFRFQQIRKYLVEHGAVPGLRVTTTNNAVFE